MIPELWIPALLYEPEKLTGKTPVVLNVNGHEGTGISTPYIQLRCINLAKRGMWPSTMNGTEWASSRLTNFNHYRINQIDLTRDERRRRSITSHRSAPSISCSPIRMPTLQSLAVTGLSGGGWQTIFISSLDKRVKLANPVAGYSSFVTRSQFPEQDLGDPSKPPWTSRASPITRRTAMIAPRPTLITNNAFDSCCFSGDYANSPLIWAARPFFALYKAEDRLTQHINFDAGHNYGQDNREAFYRLFRDNSFLRTVASSDRDSLRKGGTDPEQLRVELPAGNLDFHTIAMKLSRDLPPTRRAIVVGSGERQNILREQRPKSVNSERERRHNQTLAAEDGRRLDRSRCRPRQPGASSTVILIGDQGRDGARRRSPAPRQ